jgi:CDP-glycerol glycerophosphotransferase (TagB/SpsB family)
LVAPTWGGSALGEELSSLSLAPQFVQHLMAAGATVVFRPHPFSARTAEGAHIIREVHELLEQHANKTGRNHVYGAAAETEITVNEAANMSDMIVTDMSGIMGDWLFSLKPFAVVNMDLPMDQYLYRYPVSKAGVVIDAQNPASFEATLKQLIGTDTDAAYQARREMREYYLAGADNEDRAALFNEVVKRICA